ncbi:MAG TPA: SDR family NAD(P)-dependent oxidoreductase, partial [Dehalococcoidia bacterium]
RLAAGIVAAQPGRTGAVVSVRADSVHHGAVTRPLLEGKVAIITGASQGLGACLARVFARAGARVVLAARTLDKLEALAEDIGRDSALAVQTDVSDESSVREMVRRTLERFGRLDAAVNNAVTGSMPAPLAEVATPDFDSAYAVNLRGTFVCMKYQIPPMLEAGRGVVVNVISTAGVRAWMGLSAYAATKAGIDVLTKVAALDYGAKGIRCNTIAPGPIDTDRIAGLPEEQRGEIARAVPLMKIARPEEVANLAAWLCSDFASYVTGATIPVDGGQLARI